MSGDASSSLEIRSLLLILDLHKRWLSYFSPTLLQPLIVNASMLASAEIMFKDFYMGLMNACCPTSPAVSSEISETRRGIQEENITPAATTSSVTHSISSDQISLRIFFEIAPLKNERQPDLQQQFLKLVTSDLSITTERPDASRRSNGASL